MVNILPKKTQHELSAMYYARLFGTFLILVAVMIGIGAGVLTPAHFLAKEEAEASKRYADALQQTLTLSDASSSGRMLPVLAEQIKVMKAYQRTPVLEPALDRIIDAIPTTVSVQKVGFKFSADKDGTLTVAGTAKSRAALVGFVDTLKKDPLFKNVSVPVGDLVAETDLPFTMTLTIPLSTP